MAQGNFHYLLKVYFRKDTVMSLSNKLIELQKIHGFKKLEPVRKDIMDALITFLGLNAPFLDLYLFSNGLTHEWFKVLPIEDPENLKKTWDSIQKANDLSKSKFDVDQDFLNRFVIFAEIGAGECAVFDKTDGTIWFEQSGELHKTDLDLEGFVEICLKEVKEL